MPPIVGTAGHIDHGKTALVRALTGQDTDRLPEEKRRGISIDLGFASFACGDGTLVGVVDVPGHERLVRNMIAGAHGFDLVLLVVAADDGVMPQTREHCDVVRLLGVREIVVAITKTDLVPPSRVAEVERQVHDLFREVGAAPPPVVCVSSATGAGIPELRAFLESKVRSLDRPPDAGFFRLPVDRAFVVAGQGVVVTGTAVSGRVVTGDRLGVLPEGFEVRVREIQVHGSTVGEARAGQRVALRVSGADRRVLRRGQTVTACPTAEASSTFDVALVLLRNAPRPLRNHAGIRLHVGTADCLGKIVRIDGRDAIAPGEQALARVVLREPVAGFFGDRFVLREESARRTLGGGRLLRPAPARRPGPEEVRALRALEEAESLEERIRALVAASGGGPVSVSFVSTVFHLRPEGFLPRLAEAEGFCLLPAPGRPELVTTSHRVSELEKDVLAFLRAWHEENRLARGLDLEVLRGRLASGFSTAAFRALVESWERAGKVVREENLVRLPEHEVVLDERQRALAENVERVLREAGFSPPDARLLDEVLGTQDWKSLLPEIERQGRVVRVAPNLWYSAAAVEEARSLLEGYLEAHGQVTAATFRDLLGTSRKYAIALLEYFDRTGVTLRVGDVRKAKASRRR
ncbi:MAG: selenocysteine-specific translation factor [Candidatus Binatia bacterium]|nr:MAG: selenocysteine-specific translation factor [Candidatus Binatia bacterium]